MRYMIADPGADTLRAVESILVQSMTAPRLRAVRAARLARYRTDRAVISAVLHPEYTDSRVVPFRPRTKL